MHNTKFVEKTFRKKPFDSLFDFLFLTTSGGLSLQLSSVGVSTLLVLNGNTEGIKLFLLEKVLDKNVQSLPNV